MRDRPKDVTEILAALPKKERGVLARGEGELVIWHNPDGSTREIPMGDLFMQDRHTIGEREKDGRLHGGYPF